MTSLLSSLFGRSKPEPEQPKLTFEEQLLAIGLTPEGAKNYDEMFKNSSIAFSFDTRRESFFPHRGVAEKAFSFFMEQLQGKELTSLQLNHMNNNLTPEQFGMGAKKYDLSLLTSGNIKSEQISLKECGFSDEEMTGIFTRLPEMGARSVWFQKMNLDPVMPFIVDSLKSGQITDLSTSFCFANENSMKMLAEGVEESNLTHLCLRMINNGCGKEFSPVIEALPPSVTALYLNDNFLRKPEINALIQKVPDLKALRYLNLGDCDIQTREVSNLAKALPKSVETCNLRENIQILDEGVQALVDVMNKEDCIMHNTNLFVNEGFAVGLASVPYRRKLEEAEKNNKEKFLAKTQEDKAELIAYTKSGITVEDKISQAKTPSEIKGLMFEADKYADISIAMNRLKQVGGVLTAADMMQEAPDGKKLLDVFSIRRKLPEIFSSDFITNTKDLGLIHDALCPTDKKMFNGENGHPSIQKIKNQIMAEAVKKTLKKNQAARG